MIFGFNTDVPGKDATYHVQTEDRGVKNPVVDSIIYVGGKIVDRLRTPYVPVVTTQAEIEAMVRKQHRELVDSIRSGAFAPFPQQPMAVAQTAPAMSHPRYTVQLLNQENILRDGQFWFEFSVWDRTEGSPVSGATVDVRWLTAGGEARKETLQTGEYGTAGFDFPVPEGNPEISVVVCAKGPEWREFAKFHLRAAAA